MSARSDKDVSDLLRQQSGASPLRGSVNDDGSKSTSVHLEDGVAGDTTPLPKPHSTVSLAGSIFLLCASVPSNLCDRFVMPCASSRPSPTVFLSVIISSIILVFHFYWRKLEAAHWRLCEWEDQVDFSEETSLVAENFFWPRSHPFDFMKIL